MKTRFNIFPVFVLCLGLIVGCSSSNSPADIETETLSADAGGSDENADSGPIDLNGDYDIAVTLSEASTVIPECSPVSGMLTVTGTTITGIVDDRFSVTGSIDSNGTITGGLALEDGSEFASYDGILDGEALVGTWEDMTGCSGTWRAEKVIEE